MIPKLRKVSLLCVAALTLLWAHVAPAQTLDDFKEAVGKDGCDSIPYSDLRGTCNDKQGSVHSSDSCDGKRSCSGLETSRFEDRIKIENMCLNTLKPLKDGFSDQKSELESDDEKRLIEDVISQIQTEIDAAGNKIEASKKSIEDNRAKINERVTRGQKCLDSRQAVQKAFADAIEKAKNESDPDIKPLAEQLVSKWEASSRDHEEPIKAANEVMGVCKNLR
jgi:hypothetical protein